MTKRKQFPPAAIEMSALRKEAARIAREMRKTVEVCKFADQLIGPLNVEELIAEALKRTR